MSSSLQSLLPTLLAASPLLLGAAPSPTPGMMQPSCVETNALQDTTAGYIVHPISTQQVLITTRREWMSVNTTPVHNHCITKEEPGESSEEGVTTQADEAEGEVPELDPSALPSPAEGSTLEAPDSSEPVAEEPTQPPIVEAEETATPEELAPTPVATPIPTRTIPPVPSDSTLDPGNFTPADASPTPFDGSSVPTLESLPDGSYRYLAGNFEYGIYTNEQLTANGGAVFLLTKVGNEVTGNLSDAFGQPGICVTGRLSGNMITGAAYPDAAADTTTPETVGESFVPYGSGGLQVRQPQTVGDRTYYSGALLDLTNFSQINAGSALAPTDCVIPTTDSTVR